MTTLRGVLPVLPTTFTPKGEIDYEGMRRIIDHVIAAGVDGIAIFGIASEYYKLSDRERKEMVTFLVDAVDKRVTTIVNVTSHATQLAIEEAQMAQEKGVDALMIMPPYFGRPGAREVLRHTLQVLEAIEIPAILQYAPQDTGGTELSPEAFLELKKSLSRPFSIKVEVTPPGPLLSELVRKTHGEIDTLIGNAGRYLFDGLMRGAVGVMPGTGLIEIYVGIVRQFLQGERARSFQLFNQLVPLLNVAGLTAERFIFFEKLILERRGIISSSVTREPRYLPDAKEIELFDMYYETLAEYLTNDSLRAQNG